MTVLISAMAAVAVLNLIIVTSEIIKSRSGDKTLSGVLTELLDKRFWWGPSALSRARDLFERFFCISVSLLLLTSELLQRTEGLGKNLTQSVSDYRIYLVILIFYSIVVAKHSLKKRAVTAFAELAVMGVIVLKGTGVNLDFQKVLVFFLILVLVHDIGADRFIKIYLVFLSAVYVAFAALSSFGIIASGDVTDMASRGAVSGPIQVRYALGWGHPNTAGIFLALIVIMWLLIRFPVYKWWDWLVPAAGMVIIGTVIDSRGSLLFLAVFTAGLITVRYMPKAAEIKVFRFAVIAFPLICGCFAVFSSYFFDSHSPVWAFLNSLTTGRLHFMHAAAENYSVTLLGQSLFNPNVRTLDSGYMHLFFGKGLVGFFGVIGLYSLLNFRLSKLKAYPEMILVSAYMVYFIFERLVLGFTVNLTLALWGSMVFLQPWAEQQLFCKTGEKACIENHKTEKE